jgi:hypothetical protein
VCIDRYRRTSIMVLMKMKIINICVCCIDILTDLSLAHIQISGRS